MPRPSRANFCCLTRGNSMRLEEPVPQLDVFLAEGFVFLGPVPARVGPPPCSASTAAFTFSAWS